MNSKNENNNLIYFFHKLNKQILDFNQANVCVLYINNNNNNYYSYRSVNKTTHNNKILGYEFARLYLLFTKDLIRILLKLQKKSFRNPGNLFHKYERDKRSEAWDYETYIPINTTKKEKDKNIMNCIIAIFQAYDQHSPKKIKGLFN